MAVRSVVKKQVSQLVRVAKPVVRPATKPVVVKVVKPIVKAVTPKKPSPSTPSATPGSHSSQPATGPVTKFAKATTSQPASQPAKAVPSKSTMAGQSRPAAKSGTTTKITHRSAAAITTAAVDPSTTVRSADRLTTSLVSRTVSTVRSAQPALVAPVTDPVVAGVDRQVVQPVLQTKTDAAGGVADLVGTTVPGVVDTVVPVVTPVT